MNLPDPMKRFPFLRCIAFAGILLSGIPCRGEVPQTLSYQGRVSVNGINFSGTGQFKFALVDAGQNQNQTATANAFATLMLTSITVVSGGSGYVDAPVVTISPPDDPEGVQATATATIEGGIVTGISIIAAGSGYFNHPQVTIAPPPPNVVHQIYWSNSGDLAPGEVPGTSVSLPVVNGLYSVRLGDNSLPNMAAFFVPEIFYTPLYLRVWFDDGVHGLQQLTPDQPLSSAPYAMHSRLAETVPPGSIGAFQLANGAVSSFKLADGSVTPAKIADASIPASKLATPTAPAAGQMLRFDGTQFVWSPDGLALPFAGAATTSNAAFSIQNNSNGAAIEANGTAGDGLKALTGGSGKSAVFGQNNTFTGGGQGVYGYGFFNATGVLGVSNGGDGVHGKTEGTGKSGVFGLAIGPNSSGVHGASDLHHGVYAATGSADRAAIWAWAPNGAEAMHGHSVAGDGVVGYTAKDIINIAPGGGFFIPTMESRKAGVHGWTDKLYGLGGRFVNTNGGTALFVSGASNLSGNVTVSGNLLVTGSLTLNGGSSLPPIFGQGTTSYVPHMLVCGTYNNAAQFPSGGATPLFQVGNVLVPQLVDFAILFFNTLLKRFDRGCKAADFTILVIQLLFEIFQLAIFVIQLLSQTVLVPLNVFAFRLAVGTANITVVL